jgi:hypothetical protein
LNLQLKISFYSNVCLPRYQSKSEEDTKKLWIHQPTRLQQQQRVKPRVNNGGDVWLHALLLFQQPLQLDSSRSRHINNLERSTYNLILLFDKLLKCCEILGKMLIIVYNFWIVWTLLIWIDTCFLFKMI